jgi:hypothetical protein
MALLPTDLAGKHGQPRSSHEHPAEVDGPAREEGGGEEGGLHVVTRQLGSPTRWSHAESFRFLGTRCASANDSSAAARMRLARRAFQAAEAASS